MVELKDLVSYLNNILEVDQFHDYCPNGLQIAGRSEIKTVISGVTASQALIEQAIKYNADMLLVHHGYFWKGENESITGIKYQRIKRLIETGINLVAYHLPLDAHPLYGNNAKLAELFDLEIAGQFPAEKGSVGMHGRLKIPITAREFSEKITQILGRVPLHIGIDKKQIESIAWCSGAAQNYIVQAAELGMDAYLSGEISEQTVHLAREYDIQFFAAGHHATERYGVKALGEHLEQHFGVNHRFIDIDNPV